LFHKLGVFSVGALLRFYPRTYEDWSQPLTIEQAPFGVPCAIRAVVLYKPIETRIRKGMTLYKTSVTDGIRDLQLTFFNNPYIVNTLTEGKEYIFYGKVSGTLLRKEMSVPEFYPVSSAPSVCPIYRQTEGLSTRMISNAVKHALTLLPEQVKDPIPYDIRMQYHLCELRYALEQIHFPDSMESMKIAKKRLVFEELFTLQLGLLELKYRKSKNLPPFIDYTNEFFRLLPFTLPAHKTCHFRGNGRYDDLKNRSPMSRLVQGDVGSGKTAVAAALCYSVIKNGVQAALMAPTEILAQQHYASISNILKNTGISVGLLTGSVTPAKKRKLIEQLQDGSIQMVIGTHALISETVAFKNLGLVITDEQHRFGVAQRSLLAEKGNHPHMLVMSATPFQEHWH
ncbi:MAG: DEAD/DEAH box helicase, partial [Acutalibacteraceae bacterium]